MFYIQYFAPIHPLCVIADPPFKLVDEYYEAIEPGLSSYAEKPADVSLTSIFRIHSFYFVIADKVDACKPKSINKAIK